MEYEESRESGELCFKIPLFLRNGFWCSVGLHRVSHIAGHTTIRSSTCYRAYTLVACEGRACQVTLTIGHAKGESGDDRIRTVPHRLRSTGTERVIQLNFKRPKLINDPEEENPHTDACK